MTRKDALAELIAKVEAGGSIWPGDLDRTGLSDRLFGDAYNGSLDAAMALHKEVLPDHGWRVEWVAKYPSLAFVPSAWCASVGWGLRYAAYANNPARAWLLAILRALHAQEQA